MNKKKQGAQGMISVDTITQSILLLRGHKIILDTALADLYGVDTRALIQAVRRNLNRFPTDFMFQLTVEEAAHLRSHFVTLKKGQEERMTAEIPENLRSQFVISKKSREEQVSYKHTDHLKSQFVTSNQRGGRRYLPYAFTEQEVAMLSSVLRSDKAVRVNIEIMRAFVRLRQMLESHKELARKLENPEKKYDAQFKVVFDAIRQLMEPPAGRKKRSIGFAPWKND